MCVCAWVYDGICVYQKIGKETAWICMRLRGCVCTYVMYVMYVIYVMY